MIFTTTSVWDDGHGCSYYTKEKFLEEVAAMIDGCVANGGTYFDCEIMTDESCYLIEDSEELT